MNAIQIVLIVLIIIAICLLAFAIVQIQILQFNVSYLLEAEQLNQNVIKTQTALNDNVFRSIKFLYDYLKIK